MSLTVSCGEGEPAVHQIMPAACGGYTFDLRSQVTLKDEFFSDSGNFARIVKFGEQYLICNSIRTCCVGKLLFHPPYSFSFKYPDYILIMISASVFLSSFLCNGISCISHKIAVAKIHFNLLIDVLLFLKPEYILSN